MLTENPFFANCPTLNKLHFILGTYKHTFLITISPILVALIVLSSASLTLLFLLVSRFKIYFLCPIIWLLHPVSRSQFSDINSSSCVVTINKIGSSSDSSKATCASNPHSFSASLCRANNQLYNVPNFHNCSIESFSNLAISFPLSLFHRNHLC